MSCKHIKWDYFAGVPYCTDCERSARLIISDLQQQLANVTAENQRLQGECAAMRGALESETECFIQQTECKPENCLECTRPCLLYRRWGERLYKALSTDTGADIMNVVRAAKDRQTHIKWSQEHPIQTNQEMHERMYILKDLDRELADAVDALAKAGVV